MIEIQRFEIGDLVEVIEAPNQNKYFMKHLYGKVGMILENVPTASSKNFWKILLPNGIYFLHGLDLKILK